MRVMKYLVELYGWAKVVVINILCLWSRCHTLLVWVCRRPPLLDSYKLQPNTNYLLFIWGPSAELGIVLVGENSFKQTKPFLTSERKRERLVGSTVWGITFIQEENTQLQ